MEWKQRTLCFTGHRNLPQQERQRIAAKLEQLLRKKIEEGYCCFAAGGAPGFDTLAAQTVLRLREEYPQIRLQLILPFRGQEAKWQQEDRLLYRSIMAQADVVDFLLEGYINGCYEMRNHALVDCSSACICYLTHPIRSGTAQTVRYAQKKGLPIYNIAD